MQNHFSAIRQLKILSWIWQQYHLHSYVVGPRWYVSSFIHHYFWIGFARWTPKKSVKSKLFKHSSCKIWSALPIQEVNYGSANIFGTHGLCEFHILNMQSGSKGWNSSRHPLLIKLMQAEKEIDFFTKKLHVQMANSHRHSNAFFLTHLIFHYCLPLRYQTHIVQCNRKGLLTIT